MCADLSAMAAPLSGPIPDPAPLGFSYRPELPGAAGRIGLIALATDFNSEGDLRRLLPADTALFTTRIANANPITVENLHRMADDLPRAASTLLPGFGPGIGIDVAIFGCTSGSAVIGSDGVAARIAQSLPGVPVTNPLLASRLAFAHLGISRLALVTPYIADVTRTVARQIVDAGFGITRAMDFGLENDPDMTAIPPDILLAAAIAANSDDADAVFISCTAIRAAEIAARAETILGKPVITSNQALVWHALQLLGYRHPVSGFGQLLDHRNHTPPSRSPDGGPDE